MKCQCCRSEFTISRFTSIRQSRGTGGASPPLIMGVALAILTILLLTAAILLHTLTSPLTLRLSAIPMGLIWSVAFGAWLTCYQDAHIVICPHCRIPAGTRWPWTQ